VTVPEALPPELEERPWQDTLGTNGAPEDEVFGLECGCHLPDWTTVAIDTPSSTPRNLLRNILVKNSANQLNNTWIAMVAEDNCHLQTLGRNVADVSLDVVRDPLGK